jgi:hypothetical protein
MMKKVINKILLYGAACFLLTMSMVSCKRTLPDNGKTAVVNMANGWWVTYSVQGTPLLATPVFFSTYNTSENTTDSLWIDDLGNFWDFKGKVASDYTHLTFSNNACVNTYYDDTAQIANGKILLKAGHSRTGVLTDSIYFEIKFSDDEDANGNPAPYLNTYVVSGTARTGIIADDY